MIQRQIQGHIHLFTSVHPIRLAWKHMEILLNWKYKHNIINWTNPRDRMNPIVHYHPLILRSYLVSLCKSIVTSWCLNDRIETLSLNASRSESPNKHRSWFSNVMWFLTTYPLMPFALILSLPSSLYAYDYSCMLIPSST